MAKQPDSIGQFEQLVLSAILSLRDDAYGVSIHAKASELAHPKTVSLGAVYVTLDRLEDKRLIVSQAARKQAIRDFPDCPAASGWSCNLPAR
jgi:PadR family transcriptional regulator, regulatory protein PadR